MNATIALSIAKTFIVWTFKEINNGPCWGVGRSYLIDNRTFQDICDQDYNSDLDECLDKFFIKIINKNWCKYWLYELGFAMAFQNPIDDIKYVCDTLSQYLDECSLDDLRELLDLNNYLK